MHIANWIIMIFVPGGWLVIGLYKLYVLLIQQRSHDTQVINDMLSDIIMYRKGRDHKPYVGSFIKLTDDISSVTVSEDGSLTREFKC